MSEKMSPLMQTIENFCESKLDYLGSRCPNKTHTQYVFKTKSSIRNLSELQFQRFLTTSFQHSNEHNWKFLQWNRNDCNTKTTSSNFSHVLQEGYKFKKHFSFKTNYSSTQEFGTRELILSFMSMYVTTYS